MLCCSMLRCHALLCCAALDDALEERGAYIEGGAGGDAISLGFQCLAEDAREILGLFAEVALTPALPQAKLDLYKSQVRTSHR